MKLTRPFLFLTGVFLLSCSDDENDVAPNGVPEAEKPRNSAFYQADLDSSGTDIHLVFSPEGQGQTDPAYWV